MGMTIDQAKMVVLSASNEASEHTGSISQDDQITILQKENLKARAEASAYKDAFEAVNQLLMEAIDLISVKDHAKFQEFKADVTSDLEWEICVGGCERWVPEGLSILTDNGLVCNDCVEASEAGDDYDSDAKRDAER